MSDRVMVMYAGKAVEVADTADIFKRPSHPYTVGLINSRPDMGTTANRLHVIPGGVPDLIDVPSGCPFHPRCEHCTEKCKQVMPPEVDLGGNHKVCCWRYEK